ncbi:MAG: hypothetical protein AAGC70_17850 [Pseudomonadota bacterium]
MTTKTDDNCHDRPRRRALPSSPALTERDASIAKGMLLRGDAQHSIAAWFGVNPGRIAEIATGERFPNVAAADFDDLPPPGPYAPPCQLAVIEEAVITARRALEAAERIVSNQCS